MKTRKSINIYGNRRPKTGRLVANPIPPENIFWYDIFEPIVEAINKLFNGTSLTYKESDTVVFGPDNSINVNVNLLNRLNGNSLFQGRNIPFATINGEKIFDSNKNIIIEGGGGSYIAGDHIIIENNVISADLSDYYNKNYISERFNYLNTEIDSKQDILIAGDNITIREGNIISATNTTYNAGQNITILNGVISAIDTTYEGSDFDIKDLSDSTNLKSLWSGKQDKLIAGTNIIITGNTISAVQSAGFAVLIVTELPETGDQNTIYFLSNPTGTFPNIYNEYMYINNNWELIGNTAIDLSNYYTKSEIGTIVNGIETEISSKQSTLIAGNNITINGSTISATDTTYSDATQTTAGLMSSTDKIKLDGLSNYVLPTANSSVLGGIKIGNNLTIDANGVVSATDTTYSAGNNINIANNAIKAVGYRFNTSSGAFSEGDRYIDDSGATRAPSVATGIMAHAEGINTNAVGRASHAEGTTCFATGIQSHAEGFNTNAIGVNSHTEGRLTVTNGYASHAEGNDSETGGNYASATTNPKAADSRTASVGDYAHSEGLATIAYGVASHAEGRLTFAKGDNSHAEGRATKTLCNGEHAQGSYNVSHHATDSFDGNAGNTVHSTGIGTADNARKNAFEIMQSGQVYLLGVGNYDGIHIKGETGAPSGLQTLQEVISSLQWKIRILEPVKNNEIRYKSSDENIIYPSMQEQYTALTYNEKGILVFNNNLTEIEDDAFADITSLIEIELPEYEDFYRIGNNSFKGTRLKEIVIQKYIIEIGDYAFAECVNLKIVKYNSTMDNWNNITLGSDIFANTQVSQVICIDGVVTI